MRHGSYISGLALASLSLGIASTASAGLTHRYSFNDGTANDSVGGAHGTPIHGVAIANGIANFANDGFKPFAETGQYIDLPNQLARTPALTLESWFTFRGGGTFQELATFGTGTAGEITPQTQIPSSTLVRGTEYIAIIPKHSYNANAPAGTIRSDTSNSIEEPVLPLTPLTLNTEHHLAYTVDFPNRTSVLYIDGQEAARRAITIDPSLEDQVNNWLGRSQWSPDPFFNGAINEFRIYDAALSSADVAASFAAGPNAVVPEPSMIGVMGIGIVTLLRRTRRA